MAGHMSSTANLDAPNKKQKTSPSAEEIPLQELVVFLLIRANLNLFREYLP